jgi:hypothetical protein
MLVLFVLAGCAQPVDVPAAVRTMEAASVADLQATAERVAAELPGRTGGLPGPAPFHPDDARALERRISPAEWKRLEEAARPELPALVAEVQKLAAQR